MTTPEFGPETWVVPVGDRWATIRFWPASPPDARHPHPPYVTVAHPAYERRVDPDDLDRYADTLKAAAQHQRQRTPQPAAMPGQLPLL